MNKKLLFGFVIFAIGTLLLSTIGRAEDYTKFYFSDELTPGNEIKWNVETLQITGDLENEVYFDINNYNLTEGDVIKLVVEEDPDNLPQPFGWAEQDWFDVYINNILVYENSSEFYNDQFEEDEDILPTFFVLPSQAENSTGVYYIHDILYEEWKNMETHTTTSTSETYSPYEYETVFKMDVTVEKDADALTLEVYMYMKFTMINTTENKIYYLLLETNAHYRLNKDGLADQYFAKMKIESVVPTEPAISYSLKQMDEPGNGTVEFNIVREGYNPLGGNGGTNTFTIPFSVLGPIISIIAVGIILKRRK